MRGAKETPPEAGAGFTPPRLIDSMGDSEPWTQWQDEFDHTSGISGLYIISDDTVVVDNRGLTHHNGQLRALLERVYSETDRDFDNVMPWAVGFRKSYSDDTPEDAMTADLELPRSAGGLTQAYRKMGLENTVRVIQQGMDVSSEVLWPVVWACKVLGVPEETTVRFSHAGSRYSEPDVETGGLTVTYTGSRRQMGSGVDRVFPLRQAYRELSFIGALPEPKVDRDVDVHGQ